MDLKRQLGLGTAILIIIADVIGTGIFVTTGDVLNITKNAPAVLLLWLLGGTVAITGSMCYAELASMWPDDGGEFIYLRRMFGALPSFLTGWISLIIGFSASVAISSMTLLMYLGNFFNNSILSEMWVQKIIAAGIIFIFGMMHIIGVKRGSIIQNILTVLKLGIVFLLIAAGFYAADWGQAGRLSADYASKGNNVVEYGFALLIIMFAYSGWNGATYIAGEVKNPERNLPRALVISSVAIVAIYFALNVIFILATPGEELMKTNAVGAVAVQNLFSGSVFSWEISSLFTLCIVLILLSSVSVQLMVGPRVYYAMAKDRMIFQSLSKIHPKLQTPYLAIILQMFIAIIYVFIGRDSIAALLGYMGFSLGIFPLLTVIGMVYMRYKNPGMNRTYKVPFFPLVPAIYIILTLLMMIGSLFTWTKTSLIAIAVVMIGIPIFYIWQHIVKSKS